MCKVVRVLKTQHCVPHSYSWEGFRCIIVIHGVGSMFDVVFMCKWVSLKKVKVSNFSFLSTVTIKGGHLRNLKILHDSGTHDRLCVGFRYAHLTMSMNIASRLPMVEHGFKAIYNRRFGW